MIEVTSISTHLGTNRSFVTFKVYDTSTPLHRVTGEYKVEIDGRYDDFYHPELIAQLEAMLEAANDAQA